MFLPLKARNRKNEQRHTKINGAYKKRLCIILTTNVTYFFFEMHTMSAFCFDVYYSDCLLIPSGKTLMGSNS